MHAAVRAFALTTALCEALKFDGSRVAFVIAQLLLVDEPDEGVFEGTTISSLLTSARALLTGVVSLAGGNSRTGTPKDD